MIISSEAAAVSRFELLQQKIQKNYKAFLYDCDGTLADNMQAHKDAYVKVAIAHGVPLDPALIDELAGWPTLQVISEINRRYDVALDPVPFATAKSKVFFEEYIEHTQPVDHVVAHLKQHAGIEKIAVVSGGSRRTVTKTLTVLGLYPLIDELVCAGETPNGKPFPDPFLRAAELLGVAPEDCLVFEDGEPGVASAIAAGMDWIRIDQL
jgi:HAD superfamily hydrolase (TIGR01509 family)